MTLLHKSHTESKSFVHSLLFFFLLLLYFILFDFLQNYRKPSGTMFLWSVCVLALLHMSATCSVVSEHTETTTSFFK